MTGSAYVLPRPIQEPDEATGAAEYERLGGGAGVSVIVESTRASGVGPRLHRHPYAETFVIRRGSATFTVDTEVIVAVAGQVLVVPAQTPHAFKTGPHGYEAIHIHASERFITEWLE